MNSQEKYATLGIDIGSTTVKIAILDENHNILFSDYERHFANIRETLSGLLKKAYEQLGELQLHPMITGSGGLTLANHLGVPFTQEVVAVATSLQELAPKTDVAIELGGEDAKIIYFEGGNVEQRMNGICVAKMLDKTSSIICAFGLAAAAPRSPCRHLELCGIALKLHAVLALADVIALELG